MKKIAAVIMIGLMVCLSPKAFSYDRIHFSGNTTKEKMMSFAVSSHGVEIELEQLETQLKTLRQMYGQNFAEMSDGALKNYISVQTQYASHQQSMIDGLSRVYFVNYSTTAEPIEEKMNAALKKTCRFIAKMTFNCLSKHQTLVFKAKYLSLEIEELDALVDSLSSQIDFDIKQEDGIMFL